MLPVDPASKQVSLGEPGAFPVMGHIPCHLASIPVGLAHSQSWSPAWLLDMTPNQCPSVMNKGIRLQKCILREKDVNGFPEARYATGADAGGRNKIGFKRTTDLEFLETQLLCCVASPFLVSVFCHGSTNWLADCFDHLTEKKMFKCVFHWLSLDLWGNGDI